MRRVGDVMGDSRAERFVNFLAAQGIEAESRDDGSERFSLWILDEDKLSDADEHFRAFKSAPDAKIFDAPARAKKPVKSPVQERFDHMRSRLSGSLNVTWTLIGISVALTLAMNVKELMPLTMMMRFSIYPGSSFPEISNGEVWRLVTPIFLHGSPLHLFFNMLWLYQLGGAIETNEGSRRLLVFVIITAALCNIAEYLVTGPYFLGMSGVVYALFGYVWIMSRYQAASPYFISQETVIIMIAWLVVCLVGLLGNVANTEHVAGLFVGSGWGFLRSRYLNAMIRRRRGKH